MKEFIGAYVGFSPSDESPVGFGEMEIALDEERIRVRVATGSGIYAKEVLVGVFEKMTEEEIASVFGEGTPNDIKTRIVGFKGPGTPRLYFIRDPKEDEFGLFVSTGMGDMLGPTILFAPKQVALGLHEKAIQVVEQGSGMIGAFPRLHNDGKSKQ